MPPHRGWLAAGQAVASIFVEGMHNYVNAVEDNKYLNSMFMERNNVEQQQRN